MARYVEPHRIWPLLAYAAAAFAFVLTTPSWLPQRLLGWPLTVSWLLLFPLGGWWVWRLSGGRGPDTRDPR